MIATWYGITGFMLIVYVVLDGRNFGAGMLHWLVARTPGERRQVIAAIGPLWSWHEVWLVGREISHGPGDAHPAAHGEEAVG